MSLDEDERFEELLKECSAKERRSTSALVLAMTPITECFMDVMPPTWSVLTSKRSIARLTDLQIDQVFGKWRHLHRGGASSISAAGVAAPSRPESSAALSPREMPSTSVLSSAPRSSKKLIHKFPNTPVGLVVVSGQTGCRQALLSGHQPFPTDTRKLSGLLSCQTCQNA